MQFKDLHKKKVAKFEFYLQEVFKCCVEIINELA